MACRPGGIVSVIGVYGGLMDKFPTGAFMNKGLSCAPASATCSATSSRSTSASATARSTRASSSRTGSPLDVAPDAYETFKHKQDECVKVVLKP